MSFFGGMGQSAIKNLGNGGTMDGDVTVTGDLTVNGGIALTLSEVLQGTSTIDVNSTEALLVRKNGDGGDIFIVDTTNSKVIATELDISGNVDIDGTTNLDIVDIDGAVDIAGDVTLSGTNSLKVSDGGAGSPRYTFTSDQDTGMFRPSNNALAFTTGGVQRLNISDTGIVSMFSSATITKSVSAGSGETAFLTLSATDGGVNMSGGEGASILFKIPDDETNPSVGASIAGVKENADDSISNTALVFRTSQNDETLDEVMRISSTGAVGIGTANPSTLLNLESATSTAITAENTGNSAVALNLDANRSGADQGLGNINFKWNGTAVAQISGASGADTTNKDDGQIQFSTMSGGSSSVNMTLDKDGKLGLGISPVFNSVHIHKPNSDYNYIHITNTTTGTTHDDGLLFGFESDEHAYIVNRENTNLNFFTNNTQRMQISAGGNVGIGVVPEATQSGYDSLQIGGNANITSYGTQGASGQVDFGHNYYFSAAGTDKYISTDEATQLRQGGGAFRFRTAPSGTADNAITFTERMTILQSGNIGIGTTAPTELLHLNAGSSNNAFIKMSTTGTGEAGFYIDGDDGDFSGHWTFIGVDNTNNNLTINNVGADDIIFKTTNAERLRISADGSVGIGTDSPSDYDAGGDNLVVYDSGNAGISIISATTGTSAIHFGDGTGASSYRGYINYSHGSDAFTFATGASARMSINSSGNVGIGTTSPSRKIHINQDVTTQGGIYVYSNAVHTGAGTNALIGIYSDNASANGDTLYVRNDGTGNLLTLNNDGTDRLVVKDGGNVGIGTSAPAELLEIEGTSTAFMQIQATSADSSSGISLQNDAINYVLRTNGANSDSFEIRDATNNTQRLILDTNSRISLSNNDSNTNNTVFGYTAFNASSNNGSDGNTVFGHNAMGTGAVSGALYNSAFGYNALASLTEGDENIAIGYQTGDAITTGNNNVLIGDGAGGAFDTERDNVVIGHQAFDGAVNGADYCVVIGSEAMRGAVTVDGTVAIGTNALNALTSGAENTAVGYQAGLNNASGGYNSYFGYKAGYGGSGNESFNTGVGRNSLVAITSGAQNTAIGNNSGEAITSGGINTTLGDNAGDTLATGSYNTIVGGSADVSASDSANQTVLGYGATSQGDNTVTLGNTSVTDVYMASGILGEGAYVHSKNVQNHISNTMASPYYSFQGVDHDISFGDVSSTVGKIYSASVFFYIEEDLTTTSNANGALFTGSGADDDMLWIGGLTGSYTNELILVGNSANATIYQSAGTIPAGNHHIAISWDGTQYDIWLDGIQLTTVNSGTPALLDSDDFIIGNGDNDSDGFGALHGHIYSVNIWNKSLTATEIKELYSGASVPFKYKGSTQTNLISSAFTNLSSTYEAFSGASASGFTATNSSANGYIESVDEISLVAGKSYVLNYNASITSGTYPNVIILQSSGGSHATVGSVVYTTVAGANSFVFTSSVTTNCLIRFYNEGSTNAGVVISGLTITRAGAVAEYDGSSAGEKIWGDKSGNNLHGTVNDATLENTPYDSDTEYEEGTFAIAISCSGGVGIAMDSSFDLGRYIKIGNKVTVQGQCKISAVGDVLSGSLKINGLPYTITDTGDASDTSAVALHCSALASSLHTVVGIGNVGATTIELQEFTGTTTQNCAEHFQQNSIITFSFTYMT